MEKKRRIHAPAPSWPMSLAILQEFREYKDLDRGQQKVLESILCHARNTICLGRGGCGKTETIRALSKILDSIGIVHEVTATTGVAATHILGTTLHSFIGARLCDNRRSELVKQVLRSPEAQERWSLTQILIVDEISMMEPGMMDILDDIGRATRGVDQPFGGLVILLCGDFLQLPFVRSGNHNNNTDLKSGGKRENITHLFKHPLYKSAFQDVHVLQRNFRQSDPLFQGLLDRLRVGELTPEDIAMLQAKVRDGIKVAKEQRNRTTTLYARNAKVDEENRTLFEEFTDPATRKTFRARTRITGPAAMSAGRKRCVAWLDKMKKEHLARPELELGVGARVMLLTNLSIRNHLVNGSQGILVRWEPTSKGGNGFRPVVKFDKFDQEVIVDWHTWSSKVIKGHQAIYTQMPLRLCWRITIHKGQGFTLDEAATDLTWLYQSGQAYVALSRLRSWDGLILLGFRPESVVVDKEAVTYYRSLEKTAGG